MSCTFIQDSNFLQPNIQAIKHSKKPPTISKNHKNSIQQKAQIESFSLKALSSQKSCRNLNIQSRAFSSKLTHVDDTGKATMVNVIDKLETKRIAVASGHVNVGSEISSLISKNLMKKGDVLTVSQIAGIMAAKNTSNLIPLTHNIPLSSVKIIVSLNEEFHRVEIIASVECFGKTGVEIEALTAVSVAALTVYDMCKAVSHDITIDNIKLMEKRGGKSHYKRI